MNPGRFTPVRDTLQTVFRLFPWPTEPGLRQGIHIQRLMAALRRSAREGGRVDV